VTSATFIALFGTRHNILLVSASLGTELGGLIAKAWSTRCHSVPERCWRVECMAQGICPSRIDPAHIFRLTHAVLSDAVEESSGWRVNSS
jgi:hypothetical protein